MPRQGPSGRLLVGLACIAFGLVAASADLALAKGAGQALDNEHTSSALDSQEEFLAKYVDWARSIEAQGQERGSPLDPEQLELATRIGILHPEKVRLVMVDAVPFPSHDAAMRRLGESMGFIGADVINNAQAFGYTIWVRKGFVLDRARLAHELVHVEQIERSAGFSVYARKYIEQLREFGHANMPLEREAYEANRQYGESF